MVSFGRKAGKGSAPVLAARSLRSSPRGPVTERNLLTVKETKEKTAVFETMRVPKALAVMALPTVLSQLIVLLYNLADTWFIGRTNNPYMIGAASLVMALFLSMAALANLFGVGGGNLMVRQMGQGDMEDARKTASYSVAMAAIAALVFSLLCLAFMGPLLRLLGASENTMGFSRQYLLFTVVLGGVPTVLSLAMPMLLRNAGYSREAGFGVGLGGVLNIALDPLFMFVLLPDGCQVMGAALATMLSNMISLVYFIVQFRKLRDRTVLELPRRLEKLEKSDRASFYSVGVPAAVILLLFDLVNIVLNRLAASHGDLVLAAVGIVLKVERLPVNIGLGICLGMVPLIGYNYAKQDFRRMDRFFSAARLSILAVALLSMAAFYLFAGPIIHAFIDDEETVRLGTLFLKGRCFAIPFMLLSFQVVNFMQAVNQGKVSFLLSIIRHLLLNIPALILLDALYGIPGLIWAQTVSDVINAVITYLIYFRVHRRITAPSGQDPAPIE